MQLENKFSVHNWRALLFLLSVLFLAGCSDEDADIDNIVGKHTIDFNCQTQSLTGDLRIAETTIDNLQYFRVSAIWNKDGVNYESYMNKQLVEKQGNNWVYSPIRYWPSSGSISFFAYTPATSSGIEYLQLDTTINQITIEYHLSTDHQQQEDFMVATSLERTSSPVKLNFEHALSFVKFKAYSELPDTTFRIKEIKLANLHSKGVITGLPSGSTSTWLWYEPLDLTDYIVYQKYPFETQNITYKEVGNLMVVPQVPDSTFKITIAYDVIETNESKISEHTFDDDLVFEMGKMYTFYMRFTQLHTRSLQQDTSLPATGEGPTLLLHLEVADYQ